MIGVLNIKLPAGKIRDLWVRLGDASYSIYLVHAFVLELAGKILLKTLGDNVFAASLQAAGAILATCVISMMLYTRLEKPVSEWIRAALLGARPKPAQQSA